MQAQDFIEELGEALDNQIGDVADIDFDGTSLTITLEGATQGQYLLNYHGTTKQLWLSSPSTGAHHFEWQKGAWVCTKSGGLLQTMLASELKDVLNCEVDLAGVE